MGDFLFGGTYRTAVELTSRGTNFRFVPTNTDWVPSLSAGGPGGVRTHDLCVANAALSQLSYKPTSTNYYRPFLNFVNTNIALPKAVKIEKQ